MPKNRRWPENCVWSEPATNGGGIWWEEDDVDPMLLDEDGQELLEIKEYFDTLVEVGRLNEDYSLNEDYEEFGDGDTPEDSDDWDEPEEFVPEMGEDYWDDGFNIQAWEEDFSDHVSLLKILPCSLDKDPIIFVRGVIGYEFVNENLLRQAFTRRAFAVQYGLGGCSEELEFLGDAVLNSIVTRAECKARLPEDMLAVLNRFDEARGRAEGDHDEFLAGNSIIEDAIEKFYAEQSLENLTAVLESIRQRMHEDGHFMVPVIMPQAAVDMLDIEHVSVGDTVTSEEDLHFKMHHLETDDGRQWLVAFTSQKEFEKGESASIISDFIESILKGCRNMKEAGIIINPWEHNFLLTKELINLILEADTPDNHIYFEVGDITKMKVDAIVNAANKSLLGGGGVDGAIHRAAGIGLTNECRKLGGCETGEARITGGWLLPAKYVIHTVGPRYREGNPKCEQLLYNCYWNSLELAKEYGLHTIAFPAISTGAYRYPKQEAAAIALRAVSGWLSANPDYGMAVIMVCHNDEMRQYYQNVIDTCAPGRE